MKIVQFEDDNVRTIEDGTTKWYSVIDVVRALTASKDPGAYWRKLKQRLSKEGSEVVTNCHRFKMEAEDGKMRLTDCLIREDLLRLIQSVPSPKAEPFKIWLSQRGEQAFVEDENPDLIYDRLISSYEKRGRTSEWIKIRLRSLSIRKDLTDTWKSRGVKGSEYALLTDEIHSNVFDLSTGEHKAFKGIDKKSNLRDQLTNLELIFLSLGEELTRQFADEFDAHGFHENKRAATEGGRQAGGSKRRLEKKLGFNILSDKKFLD